MVDDRVAHGEGKRDDLLRLLMETSDPETGQHLDRQQVIDETLTFLGAGHETTAHGLTWMFCLLAQNPAATTRLHNELDTVLNGRTPTADDDLPWLGACFKEAMRIYPPVWRIPRLATEDDVISGYRIPRGTRVMFSIWTTHRDPAVYPDPTAFHPERWLGDEPAARPRHSYLPFGGGRRACVGQGFAMLNAHHPRRDDGPALRLRDHDDRARQVRGIDHATTHRRSTHARAQTTHLTPRARPSPSRTPALSTPPAWGHVRRRNR